MSFDEPKSGARKSTRFAGKKHAPTTNEKASGAWTEKGKKSIDKPNDFIRYTCQKCPECVDEEPYPEGCTCNATRDHAPTECPCRGTPDWKPTRILWREGERK